MTSHPAFHVLPLLRDKPSLVLPCPGGAERRGPGQCSPPILHKLLKLARACKLAEMVVSRTKIINLLGGGRGSD